MVATPGLLCSRDVVGVLRQAGGPLEDVHARVLLGMLGCSLMAVHLGNAMVLLRSARRQAVSVPVRVLLDAVVVHVLAEIREGGGPLQVVAAVAHHWHVLRGPVHRVALGESMATLHFRTRRCNRRVPMSGCPAGGIVSGA